MSTTLVDNTAENGTTCLSPRTLSHLFRLFGEHGMDDARLNQLFTTGILAKVLRAENPGNVNIEALERVLRIKPDFQERMRPILVRYSVNISDLLFQSGILRGDDQCERLHFEYSDTQANLRSVMTQMERPTWGRIKGSEESRGVRSADLRELLFFASMYDLFLLPFSSYFALGTRTSGLHPEVFGIFVDKRNRLLHLNHCSSYGTFSGDPAFLGIVIE